MQSSEITDSLNRPISQELLRWPEPDADTYLVRRCHELRKVPLRDLTTEDIRILVGQQIALKILVPIALEILADDLLAAGDYYPGDLLAAVLRLDDWEWPIEHRAQLMRLLESAKLEDPFLRELADRFLA